MKKAELYRSIEGIKPDRSMKNRIMTAAEANDKITVSTSFQIMLKRFTRKLQSMTIKK